ncbi:class I SAM-dependent methyltransferase [Gimesia maris]|uniref:class I SAM-dependent methyltransferase n=1 Tax=Gimesia maris TaxID=122 RepID=UPI0003002CAB|nr:class I SAM-dependent methyltransferase [Gimesia maris]QGQ31550.1 class I SAM-dependent methyltransferase [Gimesia maris]
MKFDPRTHVVEDRIGLQLANPNASCRFVPTRDHFIEDLVAEQITQGLSQFVIFAAELDT